MCFKVTMIYRGVMKKRFCPLGGENYAQWSPEALTHLRRSWEFFSGRHSGLEDEEERGRKREMEGEC